MTWRTFYGTVKIQVSGSPSPWISWLNCSGYGIYNMASVDLIETPGDSRRKAEWEHMWPSSLSKGFPGNWCNQTSKITVASSLRSPESHNGTVLPWLCSRSYPYASGQEPRTHRSHTASANCAAILDYSQASSAQNFKQFTILNFKTEPSTSRLQEELEHLILNAWGCWGLH